MMHSEIQNIPETIQLLKEELDIFSSLILKIHMDMDLETFLNELIFTLREKVKFDGCNLSIIDDDGLMRVHKINMSDISRKSKLSGDFLEKIYSTRIDYTKNNDWASVAARENREIYFPCIEQDTLTEDQRYIINNYGITALYYLPISINNKVYGTMRFHNYESPMHLTDFEIELIRRRVTVIAKAIENYTLYNDIKKKNRLIQFDLDLANELQTKMLPKKTPQVPGIEIATSYMPMIEVGGDFYDFIFPVKNNSNQFGFLITDVSGHGVTSAFITSMIKIAFQSPLIHKLASHPAKVLAELNRCLLYAINDNFATGCYTYFDMKKKKAIFASAGHTIVYRINRFNGSLGEIKPGGTVMGFMENVRYSEEAMDLEPGDRFFFYTDGLTEARDRDGSMFEVKLLSILNQSYMLPLKDFCDTIIEKLKTHALFGKRTSFEDDVAMVIIDVT